MHRHAQKSEGSAAHVESRPQKAWLEKTAKLRADLVKRGGRCVELAELRAWLDEQRVMGAGGKRLEAFRCPYCRALVAELQITLDHDLPVALGGTSQLNNLRPCCALCNRRKGEMTGQGFLRLMEFMRLSLTVQEQAYLTRKLSERPVYRGGRKIT